MAIFTITRRFNASIQAVFEAWTVPEKFSVWFGTDGVDVPLEALSMDARAGGAWSAIMHLPDGNRISWVGDFVEVDAPAHLVMTITDDPADDARGIITVDLAPLGGGTEMTMSQESPGMAQEQIDPTVVGYNAFFDAMERVVTHD